MVTAMMMSAFLLSAAMTAFFFFGGSISRLDLVVVVFFYRRSFRGFSGVEDMGHRLQRDVYILQKLQLQSSILIYAVTIQQSRIDVHANVHCTRQVAEGGRRVEGSKRHIVRRLIQSLILD